MRIRILSYTIQQVIPNVCTKFQNPRCSSSREIFDTNSPMHNIGVRNGKKKRKKRRQIRFQHRSFLLHNKLQPSVGVYKIGRHWLS